MDSSVIAGLIASILVNLFTLLTVLANGWLAARKTREDRADDRAQAEQARRWEIEDRRAMAQELAARTEFAAQQVKVTNEGLASKVATIADEARRELASAIADNTLKTEHAAKTAQRAYEEANHVNEKIEKIGVAQLTTSQSVEKLSSAALRNRRAGDVARRARTTPSADAAAVTPDAVAEAAVAAVAEKLTEPT